MGGKKDPRQRRGHIESERISISALIALLGALTALFLAIARIYGH